MTKDYSEDEARRDILLMHDALACKSVESGFAERTEKIAAECIRILDMSGLSPETKLRAAECARETLSMQFFAWRFVVEQGLNKKPVENIETPIVAEVTDHNYS